MGEQLWMQWSRPLLGYLMAVLSVVCLVSCNQALLGAVAWPSHPAAVESRL